MIDYFAILLTHGLIGLACWRMLAHDDLDVEPAESDRDASADTEKGPVKPWLVNQKHLHTGKLQGGKAQGGKTQGGTGDA